METAHAPHWHREDRVKACIVCGDSKPIGEFYAYRYVTRQGKDGTRYESRCRSCAQARRRAASAANPGRDAGQARVWRDANPGKAAASGAAYRSTDHGRTIKAIHQRLRKARTRSGSSDDAAIKAIYAEAMRIEKIVADCPVFDLPELGKKMHVDHVTPLSKGGPHEASNLQILPAGINMRKAAKCLPFPSKGI